MQSRTTVRRTRALGENWQEARTAKGKVILVLGVVYSSQPDMYACTVCTTSRWLNQLNFVRLLKCVRVKVKNLLINIIFYEIMRATTLSSSNI